MSSIFAKKALLYKGWASDVRISIRAGRIAAIHSECAADSQDIALDVVIPGLANAHSHAFQRALVGHTERRGPDGTDNFWSWRSRMYRLSGLVDAARLTAIARQAYSEMLAAGFTSVAEFHYLHSEPGQRVAGDTMLKAIVTAAADTGIRLSYVPVLYERAGFERQQPTEDQRRFAMTLEDFVSHYERARQLAKTECGFTVAIGAHSLRAVCRASMSKIAQLADRDQCPMHLHIAEQTDEVDQCLARHGKRPVEWLLQEFSPDQNWCLVHATHMNEAEREGLLESGAVICLCPSTEANLGDGLFLLQPWLEQGGKIAIGSDSHTTINPFEELRWLEYGQRLAKRSRNVAAIRRAETGRSLFEQALQGGALACGSGTGVLQRGQNADLVALDAASPMLSGHDEGTILDALVFSGHTLPIDRVMVKGEWVVAGGKHVAAGFISDQYARVANELKPAFRDGK